MLEHVDTSSYKWKAWMLCLAVREKPFSEAPCVVANEKRRVPLKQRVAGDQIWGYNYQTINGTPISRSSKISNEIVQVAKRWYEISDWFQMEDSFINSKVRLPYTVLLKFRMKPQRTVACTWYKRQVKFQSSCNLELFFVKCTWNRSIQWSTRGNKVIWNFRLIVNGYPI